MKGEHSRDPIGTSAGLRSSAAHSARVAETEAAIDSKVAFHGFWAWAEDLRGQQGLRRSNEREKGGAPVLGDIFSGGWVSKMEIPDETYAITGQLVGNRRYIGSHPDNLAG
jgi:hypothetical protein